jgi:O-antigen ligase
LTGKPPVVAGAILLAIVLPSLVNPWAALPFEPVKVDFLRVSLVVLFAATLMVQRGRWWRQVLCGAPFPSAIRGQPLGTQLMLAGAVLFALSNVLSTLLSGDIPYSLWGGSDRHGAITALCGVLLYLLLASQLRSSGQVLALLLALTAGSVPVCLYGFVQFTGFDPLAWQTDSVSPVLSTMGRSNFVAAYLAVIVPLTLVIAWRSLKVQAPSAKVAGTILVGLQVGCLALTEARAGWLAFVTGCAVFLAIACWPRGRRTVLLTVVLFAVSSSIMFWGLERALAPVMESSPLAAPTASVAERREESIGRRYTIWRHTLPLIGERWFAGYGPEMFMPVFNRRYPPGTLYDGSDTIVDDPHNVVLELAVNIGLVGVAAWLFMVCGYFIRLYQWPRCEGDPLRRQLNAGLAGAMVAYLIQAQLNPDVVVLTMLYWLLLAIVTGLRAPPIKRVAAAE